MNIPVRLIIFVVIAVLAGDTLHATPLFESDDPLAVTIEAPMRELIRTRAEKTEFAAVVRYTDAHGAIHALPAMLSARGNKRLETCNFPPLRLEFAEGATAGTLFAGQVRLKMVNPCDRGARQRDWLLQEYAIYRAYNVVTDYSYRVRQMNVTFRDPAAKRWERTYPAFVIEATDEAASRLGRTSIRPPEAGPARFDKNELAQAMLFQYLIGNTDFAVRRGPSGEGCCHNGRILASPGAQDGWVVLPYDFDQAGLINTDYSLPDERLGIRAVTQRLYRGFCWHNDALPGVIANYRERQSRIVAALLPDAMSTARRKRAGRFIDRFYDIVNDPRELQSQIMDKCRGAASFEVRKTSASSPR